MAKAELQIAGKRYALSCAPGQEGRLEELGARFDQRVKELIEALGDLGAERLFLAAGLSILDELDAQAANSGSKALDDRIRTGPRSLNLKPVAAANDLSRDGLGKSRFDTVPHSLRLELKCRHRDRFDILRQT